MQASFNQSEEVFYRSHITIYIGRSLLFGNHVIEREERERAGCLVNCVLACVCSLGVIVASVIVAFPALEFITVFSCSTLMSLKLRS